MNKQLNGYGHMHIDAYDEEYGTVMCSILEGKTKHQIIDGWGDITGEKAKLLGEYDSAFEAIKSGINMIKKRFPNAKIIYGAGQAPNEWIEEILKSKPKSTKINRIGSYI